MENALRPGGGARGEGSTLQFSSRVAAKGDQKGFQSDNMKIESFCVDLSEFQDDDDEGFCDDYNPPPRFG